MAELLKPKDIEIVDQEGEKRTYVLSKFDAISGREICTQYPLSALPKLGDYPRNEELAFKIMTFVGVRLGDTVQPFMTKALIKNHVPDWETLLKIEKAMIEYNCSFFLDGSLSTFLGVLAKKIPPLISKILMDSLAQSLPARSPPSTNSPPSTT